ncbi:type II/IV secretion system protein [Pseudidiomarina sp. 1APR75-33.1]|uniref:GspE/PulE family protein n=1 Tax=Pseudidiomarina terrestris TaxID=2820060 RepID=UPI00264E953E|nr:GspE/PulE family protein [Pseudidiomarina sp. 1APR75-33.1]MDN7126984.1 type II/IV secretion system protein [Pseudidiomarina sp. 1APR75-33.1]
MSTANVTQLFTERFRVNQDDLTKALQFQSRNGGQLEQILVRMGALSSEYLPAYYAEVYELQRLGEDEQQALLDDDEHWNQLHEQLPAELASKAVAQQCVPIAYSPDQPLLKVVCTNPSQPALLEFVANLGALDLQLVVVGDDVYNQLKNRWQQESEGPSEDAGLTMLEEDRLRELASEAPTVNLLNNLIAKALRRRASDMHIEPWKGKGRVRYRIDGVLHEADFIPMHMVLPVVTRLKLLSSMDIAEKRRPQDGKIELRIDGLNVDVRVSALPVGEGESVVMRFLLQDNLAYDVKTLGIEPDVEAELLRDIQATSGVILLTGPTGSGKTTSLYSFLSRRNEPDVKIITIEDPVEYQLDGINQVHVQSDIGFTFANALRSVVRQDPDIIMVGEIRDAETAGIALQSALTGHLVFSTLHTNDAASAYTRLLDLGVEEFLLSAAIKVIVGQRLARKLCPHCKQPDPDAAANFRNMKMDWLQERFAVTPALHKAVGCDQCANTGYKGRVALIEYMRCDEQLTALLGDAEFLTKARRLNRERGYRNLLEDGVLKALRGETTLAEVVRVAG